MYKWSHLTQAERFLLLPNIDQFLTSQSLVISAVPCVLQLLFGRLVRN